MKKESPPLFGKQYVYGMGKRETGGWEQEVLRKQQVPDRIQGLACKPIKTFGEKNGKLLTIRGSVT